MPPFDYSSPGFFTRIARFFPTRTVNLGIRLCGLDPRQPIPGLVAHEDSLTMGFGGGIAARIGQNCFEYLVAPVRVAAADTFVPTAPNLEEAVLPSSSGLRDAIEDLLLW